MPWQKCCFEKCTSVISYSSVVIQYMTLVWRYLSPIGEQSASCKRRYSGIWCNATRFCFYSCVRVEEDNTCLHFCPNVKHSWSSSLRDMQHVHSGNLVSKYPQLRLVAVWSTLPDEQSFTSNIVFRANKLNIDIPNTLATLKRYRPSAWLHAGASFWMLLRTLARYVMKLWVAHVPGMPGTFSPPMTSKESAT